MVKSFNVEFDHDYLFDEFASLIQPFVDEFNYLYWEDKHTIAQLEQHYGLKPLRAHVRPLPTGRTCGRCGGETVYDHRRFRNGKQGRCILCNHCERGECECAPCRQQKQEAEASRQAVLRSQREAHRVKVTQPGYANAGISGLTRTERIVLNAIFTALAEDEFSWGRVCDLSGVAHHQPFFDRFIKLGLFYPTPDGTSNVVNETLDRDLVKIPEEAPQETPSSLNGKDREGWNEELRRRRNDVHERRRKRLPEVLAHWAACRRTDSVSDSDADFIYRHLDLYEPDWIMEAISIATRQPREDYAAYVGGILRKKAEQSTLESCEPEDSRLRTTKATPRQLDYIRGLLAQYGFQLDEIYPIGDFEELSMLDAQQLIGGLKMRERRPEVPQSTAAGSEGRDTGVET